MPEQDERHGIIATPTAEEENMMTQQKQEAYLALAESMTESVEIEPMFAPDDSEAGRLPSGEYRTNTYTKCARQSSRICTLYICWYP